MTSRFKFKRIAAVALMTSMLAMFLTSCWDSREIDKLLILTGIALDVSDVPGQISITVQVADIKNGDAGSGEGRQAGAGIQSS
jgi:hypothetical protein